MKNTNIKTRNLMILAMLCIFAIAFLFAFSAVYAEEIVQEKQSVIVQVKTWFSTMWAKYGNAITTGLYTIISAIVLALVKKIVGGAVDKINNATTISTISDSVANSVTNKIKQVETTIAIEPFIKAEIAKVMEIAYNDVKKDYIENDKKLYATLMVLKSLSAYFDNSIGITQDSKEKLAEEIKKAEALYNEEPTSETKVVVETEEAKPLEEEETIQRTVEI